MTFGCDFALVVSILQTLQQRRCSTQENHQFQTNSV